VLGVQRALRIVAPQIGEGADAEFPEPLAQPVLQVLAFVDALVEQQRRGLAEEQVPPARPVLNRRYSTPRMISSSSAARASAATSDPTIAPADVPATRRNS